MKIIFKLLIILASSSLCNAQDSTTSINKKQLTYFPTAYYHKQGYVLSPYKPYNIIDVRHLKVGDLAYDPSTIKRDPVTGKNNLLNAKIFRIPQNAFSTQETITKQVPINNL